MTRNGPRRPKLSGAMHSKRKLMPKGLAKLARRQKDFDDNPPKAKTQHHRPGSQNVKKG